MQCLARKLRAERSGSGTGRVYTVTYTVTADSALRIDYLATTDRATPVNLTNHAYFNLSAGLSETVHEHELTIAAERFSAPPPTREQIEADLQKLIDLRSTPCGVTVQSVEMRDVVRQVPVSHAVQDYTIRILQASHPDRPEAPETTRK